MNALEEPAQCAGIVIIFSSPNEKRFKQFLNTPSCKFILNPWGLNEVHSLWQRSYQHIPWDKVEHIYNRMGGVVRYVLEQSNVADEKMDDGIAKARNAFIDMTSTIGSQIAGNEVIYRILHYISPDHTSKNAKYVFASDYARQVCLDGLDLQQRDILINFIIRYTAACSRYKIKSE
jgi:hypothetical protein